MLSLFLNSVVDMEESRETLKEDGQIRGIGRRQVCKAGIHRNPSVTMSTSSWLMLSE
jgi:hypothetical protein